VQLFVRHHLTSSVDPTETTAPKDINLGKAYKMCTAYTFNELAAMAVGTINRWSSYVVVVVKPWG
jgi:hypothetical protein